MASSTGWHVLYVKSRHEKKVHDLLVDISIETFLPLVKTIRVWSDRKKTILKPLFPSYIFVNISSSLDFHKALSVNGACRYISFGSNYAKVPNKEINRIKFLTGTEGVSQIETNDILPKIGEKRKISYGMLNGLECEIVKVKNKCRVIVRIESLKQNITAIVPISFFD